MFLNTIELHPSYIRPNSYLAHNPNSLPKFLRAGTLQINNSIIRVNSRDSLNCLAKKINAVSNKTGVSAKVVKHKDGYKLVLQSKRETINITDKGGVLLSLYKNKLLGTNNKCLVQVTRLTGSKESNNVVIHYYFVSDRVAPGLVLSEANKSFLALRNSELNTKLNKLLPQAEPKALDVFVRDRADCPLEEGDLEKLFNVEEEDGIAENPLVDRDVEMLFNIVEEEEEISKLLVGTNTNLNNSSDNFEEETVDSINTNMLNDELDDNMAGLHQQQKLLHFKNNLEQQKSLSLQEIYDTKKQIIAFEHQNVLNAKRLIDYSSTKRKLSNDIECKKHKLNTVTNQASTAPSAIKTRNISKFSTEILDLEKKLDQHTQIQKEIRSLTEDCKFTEPLLKAARNRLQTLQGALYDSIQRVGDSYKLYSRIPEQKEKNLFVKYTQSKQFVDVIHFTDRNNKVDIKGYLAAYDRGYIAKSPHK